MSCSRAGGDAGATTGHAEAIVGIMEFWRDAGTSGAACDFDVMAPGASAGRSALAGFRATRVSFRRNCVIVGLVPIAAPLVNVFRNVVQTESIRRIPAHWF